MPKYSKTGLQQKIVEGVKSLDIKSKMNPAITRFGKWRQDVKVAKFERAKLGALKDIARKQQGVVQRGFEAMRDLGAAAIANQTARDITNPNSYRSSLTTWMSSISGNPNKSEGEEGSTQAGSTSELGG